MTAAENRGMRSTMKHAEARARAVEKVSIGCGYLACRACSHRIPNGQVTGTALPGEAVMRAAAENA